MFGWILEPHLFASIHLNPILLQPAGGGFGLLRRFICGTHGSLDDLGRNGRAGVPHISQPLIAVKLGIDI